MFLLVIEKDRYAHLLLGMRIRVKLFLFLLASSLIVTTPLSAAVKSGDPCKKVGSTSAAAGKKFTCVKSGTRLVWNKGVAIKVAPKPSPKPVLSSVAPTPTPTSTPTPTPTATPTPTPSPTPTPTPEPIALPTSFEDLFEKRKGISMAAWQKSFEIIKANKSKVGTLEIFTGPNTKPYYDEYPTAVSLVSRLFPGRSEPARTIIVRFKYLDLDWAEATLKSKLSSEDWTWLNNTENGKVVPRQCDERSKNCMGAMQQSIFSSGLSIILQGVPNSDNPNDATGKLRFNSGMLEAHEYFHGLQRIPIMGKTNVWPHAWFREGSAEWVQNMAIFYDDYKTYKEYIKLDCFYDCPKLTEADIVEFLQTSNENYFLPKFQQFLNYSLGSRFIEALVAIKGPDPLIGMYEEMGKKLSFAEAFKNVYGVEWSYAIPILAKTIYANLEDVR
jgi:hypothetical protein